MSVLGTTLDYTDRDFASLRVRLFSLISSVFPEWSDTQVANFGVLMVEMYAFVGGVITKYQDNQAKESRWSQATLRKNLIAMAKLIGYQPPTATASVVDVQISIKTAVAGITTFAEGVVVRTPDVSNPVEFRLLTPATIAAGATVAALVSAENSEPQVESFASPGTPNYAITLGRTPYLDGSLAITAANGTFTEVTNFLEAGSTDLVFTVEVDENDRATVTFGDGVIGAIPTGTIGASYKTGGGTAGNVDPGSVTVIDGSFTDEFGNAVVASVTNPNASSPAVDRASVEQIQQNAPLSLRTLTRTVTREDFEINAEKVSGVATALMLTSNEDSSIGENAGYLFVVASGTSATPTQSVLDSVTTMVTVTYPHTLTFSLIVSAPPFLTIDVSATIWIADGYTEAQAKAAVQAEMTAFFAVTNADGTRNTKVSWGYDFVEQAGDAVGKFPLSKIFDAVDSLAQVTKIGAADSDFTLNGSHSDPQLLLREWPVLGTVTVINGATGATL